jgi:YidC/Oxa1 family membrane protein insertase
MNEEMMKLYRENHVNPFGSCLPLLLQLPVFLSLFYMLRLDLKKHICGAALHAHGFTTNALIQKHSCDSVQAHSAKFLFIPDLTAKATGGVLVALIVLYVGSQLLSSLLMTVTADRNQRLMAIGLPFIFTIFIAQFPTGLIVYWVTTNLWTVAQQYIVRRRVGHVGPPPAGSPDGKARAKAAGGVEKPVPAAVGAAASGGGQGGGPRSAPPPPPRKKKKRSGRRR